jgi:hypothetical protein
MEVPLFLSVDFCRFPSITDGVNALVDLTLTDLGQSPKSVKQKVW